MRPLPLSGFLLPGSRQPLVFFALHPSFSIVFKLMLGPFTQNRINCEHPVRMVQNLRSRLIQPMASSRRGLSWRRVLGWAYPCRGLPWTWKSSSKCTQTLFPACWCLVAEAVNDCCVCSVFNYIPDLHGRETRAAVAGNDLLHERARNFV